MPPKRKPAPADSLIKRVEVKLDGSTWPLVIDHNVLIECEELTGLNLLTGAANVLTPSAKLVRGLLYSGIKRAGYKGTLADCGRLIHPGNIVMVQEALLAAWAASNPDAEGLEVEDSEDLHPTAAASE